MCDKPYIKHIENSNYDKLEQASYARLLKEAKPGDLVFFVGGGEGIHKVSDYLIANVFSGSTLIHNALIVRNDGERIVVIESNGFARKVIGSETPRTGVQYCDLWDISFGQKRDACLWLRLETPLTDSQLQITEDFCTEMHGRTYDFDLFEALRARYDGVGGDNEEDLKSLTCVELVAEWVKRVGLTDFKGPANEVTLGDFERGDAYRSGTYSDMINIDIESGIAHHPNRWKLLQKKKRTCVIS
jgi:hypothetical protein